VEGFRANALNLLELRTVRLPVRKD